MNFRTMEDINGESEKEFEVGVVIYHYDLLTRTRMLLKKLRLRKKR